MERKSTPRISEEPVLLPRSRENEVFFNPAERAIDFLTETAKRKYTVVMEGPPIYLWPPVPPLEWDNPSFVKGWELTNRLERKIPEIKRSNYVLVDDLNYVPRGVVNIRERIERLSRSSKAMQESALFARPSEQNKVILESTIANELQTKVCSVLDASFNKQKIIDQMRGKNGITGIHPVTVDKLMMVVVSPDTPVLRAEQLNMFQALYEQLRSDPIYEKVSKDQTRKAITETYHHVWISPKGNVSGITKPSFDSGFKFNDVTF